MPTESGSSIRAPPSLHGRHHFVASPVIQGGFAVFSRHESLNAACRVSWYPDPWVAASRPSSRTPVPIMSKKLGRVLLLCDQALLDMRQLSNKVTTLEQCYVGEGVDGHPGIADLSDTEVALIQQVMNLCSTYLLDEVLLSEIKADRGPSDLVSHVCQGCALR